MNMLNESYRKLSTNARRAFWLLILLGIGGVITFVGTQFTNVVRPEGWTHTLQNLMALLVGIVSMSSALLVFRGRTTLAGYLFVIGFAFSMVVQIIIVSGASFLIAGITFFACTAVAMLLFPRSLASFSPITGLVPGAIILIADSYIPWQRNPIAPADLQIASWVGAALVVLYVGFLIGQFRSLPLRTKLIITSMSLTIFPMVILGWMATSSSRQALEQNANEALRFSASQIASRVDSFILHNLETVQAEAKIAGFVEYLEMAEDSRSGSLLEREVLQVLDALRARDPEFISSYAILNENGVDIADTVREDIGSLENVQDYFVDVHWTGLPSYVSSVYLSPQTEERSLYFSAPVYNRTGRIVGVLRVRFDATVLQKQLAVEGTAGLADSSSLIVDENNIILAHSAQPELVSKSIIPLNQNNLIALKRKNVLPNLPVEELYVNLENLASGLAYADSQPNFSGEFHTRENDAEGQTGESIEQAGTVRMKTRTWQVVVVQSQEVLFAGVNTIVRGTLVIGVLSAFLGVFLAIVIAHFLANPVTKLTEAAGRFASGDLTANASITTDDEFGALSTAFNTMAGQLRGLIDSLEQRVADRTKALVASAEVSRRLSTILDQNQLVREVVDQLQEAFNYYHVHIYLFDDSKANLIMAGGTGEIGKKMLANRHKIPTGRGLVGRAAETGLPVLVGDVTKAAGWLPNPLLPETKSELAVPIAVGESVLGVLDVQQNHRDSLTQEDADLLQSIANQVAVALQNARSYAYSQRRANREALIAAIGQRIQRTSTPEEALQVAAREVGRALGSDYTLVRLNLKPADENEKQS